MSYANVAKASVVFGTRQFVAYIIAFVGHVLIARILSPADFGLVALAVSTLGLLNFSDLGISQSLTRAVSELRVRGLNSEIGDAVRNAFKVRISTGLLLGILLVISSGPISRQILSKPEASQIIQILAIGIFVISSLGALAAPVLLATQQFGRTALVDFLSGSADSIFTLILVVLGYGVIGYAYGVLAAAVLGSITGITLLLFGWKEITGGQPSSRDHSIKYSSRTLLSLGLPIAAGGLLFSGYSSFVPFAIGALGKLDEVAFYSIPFALTYVLAVLLSSPLPVILPVMTKQYLREPSSLAIHYTFLFKYILLTTIPIAVLIFLFAGPIIGILYSSTYLAAAIGLQTLAFSLIPRTLNNFLALLFQTVRRNRTIAIANLAGVFVCLPISLILIPRLSFVGGAVAFLLATVATMLVYVFGASRLSFLAFKKAHFLRPLLAASSMLPVYLLEPTGRALTLVVICVALVLYITSLSLVGGLEPVDLARINRSTEAIPIFHTVVKAIGTYAALVIRLRNRVSSFRNHT